MPSFVLEEVIHEMEENQVEGVPAFDDQDIVPELPNFARHILEGDQQAVDDGWDRGMTIRTWYLHNANAHRCEVPRLIRPVGVATSWRSQLIARWLDHILQGDPIQVFVAEPDPPRGAAFSDVAYDLIIVQGAGNNRKKQAWLLR